MPEYKTAILLTEIAIKEWHLQTPAEVAGWIEKLYKPKTLFTVLKWLGGCKRRHKETVSTFHRVLKT